jgi:hypothetical protein
MEHLISSRWANLVRYPYTLCVKIGWNNSPADVTKCCTCIASILDRFESGAARNQLSSHLILCVLSDFGEGFLGTLARP